MTRKIWHSTLFLIAFASAAGAADIGGHVGYMGNDVQKADVGVNMMIPLGMIALFPNIDYTKQDQAGLWFGNADVAFRFPSHAKNGPSYWVGAGPTYGYVSNYGSSSSGGYGSRSHAVRSQGYVPPGGGGGTMPPPTTGTGGAHTAFDQFGGSARVGLGRQRGRGMGELELAPVRPRTIQPGARSEDGRRGGRIAVWALATSAETAC